MISHVKFLFYKLPLGLEDVFYLENKELSSYMLLEKEFPFLFLLLLSFGLFLNNSNALASFFF